MSCVFWRLLCSTYCGFLSSLLSCFYGFFAQKQPKTKKKPKLSSGCSTKQIRVDITTTYNVGNFRPINHMWSRECHPKKQETVSLWRILISFLLLFKDCYPKQLSIPVVNKSVILFLAELLFFWEGFQLLQQHNLHKKASLGNRKVLMVAKNCRKQDRKSKTLNNKSFFRFLHQYKARKINGKKMRLKWDSTMWFGLLL